MLYPPNRVGRREVLEGACHCGVASGAALLKRIEARDDALRV